MGDRAFQDYYPDDLSHCYGCGRLNEHGHQLKSYWDGEEARRDLLELIPYGRVGEVEDVAQVVRWLASDDSDYVVGTTVTVDGGMTLYPGFRGRG